VLRLSNFGAAPVFTLIGINVATDSTSLVSLDLLGGKGTLPLQVVDNIVNLKALYGVDDGSGGGIANDGIVDAWVCAQRQLECGKVDGWFC